MDNSEANIRELQQDLRRLAELPLSIRAAIRADEVFSLIKDQIATIQQNADYIRQQEIILDIAKRLVEVQSLDELAVHILKEAQRLIHFSDGSIGLVGEDGIIRFPYAIGRSAESVMAFEIPVGQGLTGWVVENRQSIRIGDTRKDPRYRDQIGVTRSELDVPIIYAGEAIGVINLESTEINAFSENDDRLLATLAEFAAIAVKNAELFKQMNALTSISQRLANIQDSTVILGQILEVLTALIKAEEVSVGIIDFENDTITFTLAKGPSEEAVLKYVSSINEGLAGWAVRNQEAVRVGDVRKDKRYLKQIPSTRSELDVPMILSNRVVGVLNAESTHLNAFSNHDQYLMEALASQAALAVRHAQLYDEIRRNLEKERMKQLATRKMAAIGDVAGNLVHQMNNRIGAIRVLAKQNERLADNELSRSKAGKISGLAEEVLSDVADFRDHYKFEEPTPVDVNEIIRSAIEDVNIPSNISVTSALDDNLPLSFAANTSLKEVFKNLLNNAVEATRKGGTIFVQTLLQGAEIAVKVQDSGSGISKENRSRIFDFGFSTKREVRGLGFGLFWVQTYLNTIEGDIQLAETELGKGTTFTITLPVYESET